MGVRYPLVIGVSPKSNPITEQCSQYRAKNTKTKTPEDRVLEKRDIDPDDLLTARRGAPLLDQHESHNEACSIHDGIDGEGLLQAQCGEHLVHDQGRQGAT